LFTVPAATTSNVLLVYDLGASASGTFAARINAVGDVSATGATSNTALTSLGTFPINGNSFTAVAAETTPPSISYTPLGNTGLTTNRTLGVTVTDAGSGVPTSGIGLPVIYYKKTAAAPYTANQCVF